MNTQRLKIAGMMVGWLSILAISCHPIDPTMPVITIPATEMPATSQPLATPAIIRLTATLAPTPSVTPDPFVNWRHVRVDNQAIQFDLPASWLNVDRLLEESLPANGVALWVNEKNNGQQLIGTNRVPQGAFLLLTTNVPSDWELTTFAGRLETLVPAKQQLDPIQLLSNGFVIDTPIDLLNRFDTNKGLYWRHIVWWSPQSKIPIVLSFGVAKGEWEAWQPIINYWTTTIQAMSVPDRVVARGFIPLGETMNQVLGVNLKDVWSFNATAGQYAGIILTPQEEHLDLFFVLVTPSGRVIERVNFGLSGTEEVLFDSYLPESGEYTVHIQDAFAQAGRYKLRVTLTNETKFDQGGRLFIGQTVSGEVSAQAKPDWIFAGNAGEMITLILKPSGGQLDVVLQLFGPDGNQLINLDEGFAGDAEVLVGYELPITGDYIIRVRSFAQIRGSYKLAITAGGESTQNFYEVGDLAYGETREEMLFAYEAQVWFFAGNAGDHIRIMTAPTTPAMDLEVWLLSTDIELLHQQDDFNTGMTESFDYVLPQNDEYMILVRDVFGEAGDYQITLTTRDLLRLHHAGTLSTNVPVESILGIDKADIWTFEASVGDSLYITARPTDGEGDLILYLYDPNQAEQRRIDRGGKGETEQVLNFVITTAGTWSIRVEEFFNTGSTYQLLLEREFDRD